MAVSNASVRATVRGLGVLVLFLVPCAIVAALVQHASRLPGRYSWRFSAELLWDNVREPWFPLFACIAAAIGFSRRFPLVQLVRESSRRTRIIAASSATALTALAWAKVPAFEPIDLACLWLFAFYVGLVPRPNVRTLAIAAAETVFAIGAYLIASYAHTVGKALMLVRPARDEIILAAERALTRVPLHELLTAWTREMPTLLAVASRIYRTQMHQLLLYTLLLTCAADKRRRREMLAAITISLVVASPLYHVVPSLGPYYVQPELYAHLIDVNLVSNWYKWLERNTTETLAGRAYELLTYQYIAAMPSLHVGFTALMINATWPWPVLRWFSIVLAIVTWIVTMILGWHYFLDGLFGLALCCVVAWVVRRGSDVLVPAAFGPAEKSASPR